MKKSKIFELAGLIGISVWVAALLSERQPKAQSVERVSYQNAATKTFPLPATASVEKIRSDAAPYVDSLNKQRTQATQDAKDKRTAGNLYMQKKIEMGLASGLQYQQVMLDKVDRLTTLLNEANEKLAAKPDTIYLTPQVIQTDTIYRGLIPSIQNSNRDRKGLEKTKQGIERFFRDSIRRGGSSQIIVGYQIS